MNRFDFENEEDYGEYMSKREALPKAAFQYGQKNIDRGSLTKSGKHAERKNEKQKLDQQYQKIQQIMKKRDDKKKKGEDVYKAKY